MKKFTYSVIALIIVMMTMGTFWNKNVRQEHQIENCRTEMANRDKTIQGLEDSILMLNYRLEIYEATWDVLRGVDSIPIDGVLRYIWDVFESEYDYYKVSEPVDPIIIA